MDWNDPAARARLIDRVGPDRYEQMQEEHFAASSTGMVNGYRIRPVQSRFGRLFSIDGTTFAYSTQAQAEAEAAKLPPG